MMREFKFRVWNLDYVKWITDDPMWHYRVMDDLKWSDVFSLPPWKTYEALVFQQYTGLNDKNGKEIYDGDIIQLSGAPYKYSIEWCDYYWAINDHGALGYDDYGDLQPLNCCVYESAEVIGNIFENPELIKTEV